MSQVEEAPRIDNMDSNEESSLAASHDEEPLLTPEEELRVQAESQSHTPDDEAGQQPFLPDYEFVDSVEEQKENSSQYSETSLPEIHTPL